MMETKILNLEGAKISYHTNFLDTQHVKLLDYLIKRVKWQQYKMKFGDRMQNIAHLNQFYGDPGIVYRYSQQTLHPTPWNNGLRFVKNKLEDMFQDKYNACLLNYYRNGNDSIGWHSDDESDLKQPTVIASVSLGQSRIFELKKKGDKQTTLKIKLRHNSCLIMEGDTQRNYMHSISKVKEILEPRVNLTFRQLKQYKG